MSNMFEHNQQLGEVKATIKQGRSIDPVSYHLNIPREVPYQHHISNPNCHHPDHNHPDLLHPFFSDWLERPGNIYFYR